MSKRTSHKTQTTAEGTALFQNAPQSAPALAQSAIRNPQSAIHALPERAEYQFEGERWLVLQFAALAAELPGLAVEHLPEVHTRLHTQARPWTLLRRLFGIRPELPGMKANPDELRLWTREELLADWQITRPQLHQELAAVRGALADVLRIADCRLPIADSGTASSENPQPGCAIALRPGESAIRNPQSHELPLAPSVLLAEHNLNIGPANLKDRSWFEARVQDYHQVLRVPMARVVARNCLLAEWNIYQLEQFLADAEKCPPGQTTWTRVVKDLSNLKEGYNKDLERLIDICPFASKIAGAYDLNGVLSDVTLAIQEYKARGDTALIDGMNTALEIMVEMRRSTQMPEPRYRAEVVLYVNMARHHLWDQTWDPFAAGFTVPMFKVFGAAWKGLALQGCEAMGQPVPDLQADGPEGEYEELVDENSKSQIPNPK